MKKNMGMADRSIRLIIAAILATLFFTKTITGVLGIAAIVIAVVFTLTSIMSFCPLYTLFGINTCKTKSN